MNPQPPSPTEQLASLLLGEPVAGWITKQRNDGQSWRKIARRLSDTTDGRLDVHPDTLARWAAQDTAA